MMKEERDLLLELFTEIVEDQYQTGYRPTVSWKIDEGVLSLTMRGRNNKGHITLGPQTKMQGMGYKPLLGFE